jgi:hypothetical protein
MAKSTKGGDEKFHPANPDLKRKFVRIRTGILEHIANGKFTQNSMAVYLLLHLRCNYGTGICSTTVESLASNWPDWQSPRSNGDDPHRTKVRAILDCLQRLRDSGYISYPKGTGQRGVYPILIDKYECTRGILKGWSLDVAATTDFDNPVYTWSSPTDFGEVYGDLCSQQWSQHGCQVCGECGVRCTVTVGASMEVSRVLSATLQNIQELTRRQNGREVQNLQNLNRPASGGGVKTEPVKVAFNIEDEEDLSDGDEGEEPLDERKASMAAFNIEDDEDTLR